MLVAQWIVISMMITVAIIPINPTKRLIIIIITMTYDKSTR